MNTNIQNSLHALTLLGTNSQQLKNNIAALTSGNRLTQAATDVAALSIATSLQSQNSALRTASNNIVQAQSFLQVADGGLSQQQAIVDRMTALATQANSGGLSDSARQGLNAEFQGLAEELDRISQHTNFNGVSLLNGSLQDSQRLELNTTQGDRATGSLQFSSMNTGDTINVNGQTITAGTDFNVTGNLASDVSSLANALNDSNNAALSGFTFDTQGTTLNITANAAGEAGNQFTIDQGASSAAFNVTTGNALASGTVFTLQGGTNEGLSSGDVSLSGTAGDNLVNSSVGQSATTTARFSSTNDIQAGDSIQIDDGEGGLVNFTFVSGTPLIANEIRVGSTLEQTLENAARTINNYSGSDDYGIRQLNARVNVNNLEFTSTSPGNPVDVNGNGLDIALSTAGGSLDRTVLNNGTNAGIDVSNVTSSASFSGTVAGFSATFNNTDNVNMSIQVGNDTFTANVHNTNPSADTTIRFSSENGGFFDVTLQGGQGENVVNQTGANAFADRLNQAFSSLEFSHSREVSNFSPAGTLTGASLEVSRTDMDHLVIGDINVVGGVSGVTTVALTVNGEQFVSNNVGSRIGAGEQIVLQNQNNPNETLTLTNGNNAIALNNNGAVSSLESDLRSALGVATSQGAQFQIGGSAADIFNVSIGNSGATALQLGDLDITSPGGAAGALEALSFAAQRISAERAGIGSTQQSLGFAGNGVNATLFNQEAARAGLQDTDIIAASIQNALLTTQQQTQIASLVQGNRLQGNILGLIN